ncbi:MAG: asparaginase [Bacilli bacterium]|nr:asparaginase [Bacilli bacterium]
MKKILLITTGGTIASVQTDKGLVPGLTGEQLLNYLPTIKEMCEVEVVSLFNIDSTNIYYRHWMKLAEVIREEYDRYDGFIICHGTDTMSYTASALSYLIQNSRKPIVLTGAQKPINLDISDAKINLLDSFTYACSDVAKGVVLIFNGNVILGTRARKIRTKSFDAFKSVDYPRLAIVKDGCVIPYITNLNDETIFYEKLNPSVGLLKLIPSGIEDVLEFMLEKYEALVIESFGVGGLPNYEGNRFNEIIEKYTLMGKVIVMTTQVPNEGSDIAVYNVGHYLKQNPNILEAYDMTTEAVVTKLMWILSITKDVNEIKKLFYQTISNDILFKRDFK